MVDVFDEVDEQIRAERFRALVRRVIPFFFGAMVLAVAAVVGVWAYGQFSTGAIGKASGAYAKAMDTLQKGDMDTAFTQFGDAAKGPPGYRALALMQQAGIRQAQKKDAEAVALLDQAAKATPDKMIADIAGLKAAYALIDTASLADVTARLTPLMAADRPYRAQAREALALAKMAAGKTAEARSDLNVLNLMTDTPDTMRQRAGALVSIIDSGNTAALKSLVQAAATATPILPPPPPQDPGAQGPEAQAQAGPPQAGQGAPAQDTGN